VRIVHLKRVRFIQRRKALGLTQENLADALHVERSTVARWERAETEPQPWLRPRLAALLKVSAAELESLLADVAPVPGRADRLAHSSAPLDFSLTEEQAVRMLEGFSAYDIASRRQVVAGLAVLSGSALVQPIRQWVVGLPAPAAAIEPTPETISELEQAIVLFRRWDASGAGGLRRKAVVGRLNAVTESLTERHDPETTRRLFQAAAELAQLAGWMAYDQGLHGMAQRHYVLALHACREAAAPALGAKIIGDMTQLSTALGNYTDSLNLTRTALYGLPHGVAHDAVRAELLGLEARAYAHLGEREAGNAVRSAEACVEVWQEARGEPRPDWLHCLNQAEVDCLGATPTPSWPSRAPSRGGGDATPRGPSGTPRTPGRPGSRATPAAGSSTRYGSRGYGSPSESPRRRRPWRPALCGSQKRRDHRWWWIGSCGSTRRWPAVIRTAARPRSSAIGCATTCGGPRRTGSGRLSEPEFETVDGERAAESVAELAAVYREVYGEPPYRWGAEHERLFRERFDVQRRQEGFRLITARADGRLVGFGFGVTLQPTTPWWRGLLTPLPDEVTAEWPGRTFAVVELLVRAPWRRRHVAERIHDLLLAGRTEERATLTVLPAAAPALAAYRKWGWRKVAEKRNPLPGAPVFAVMLRDLAAPAGRGGQG